MTFAASDDLGALVDGIGDVSLDLLDSQAPLSAPRSKLLRLSRGDGGVVLALDLSQINGRLGKCHVERFHRVRHNLRLRVSSIDPQTSVRQTQHLQPRRFGSLAQLV